MERGQARHDHREYEELLAAAALGVLSMEELAALREHMRGCQSCRSTFGALLGVADAMPLQAEERTPSPELRQRLLAQVRPDAAAAESDHSAVTPVPIPVHRDQLPQAQRTATSKQRTWSWAMWGALAAAMLIVALLSGIVLDRLVLQPDDSEPDTIALQYPGDVLTGLGSLEYFPDQELLHFHAPDLPPPPDDRVYQAWLIDDGDPRPVGVIDPRTGDFVTTIDRERDDAFAITVEPAPLGSAGPTTDPVIVATLGDAP